MGTLPEFRGAVMLNRDLFLLRPDIIFLNHGSFGACPRPVFQAYQAWQREVENEPMEFLGRRLPALMRSARQALADYLHADPDDLVYVTNATTAVNIVARSLAPRLAPGDEVLSTSHEYGALDATWRFICRQVGARYVNAPLPLFPLGTREDLVEALWSAVTARTRVLFLSHITSPTALILPVADLIRRARRADILTVVDGAHAPGQIPLDLTALGADFYAGNCHKWMCSPKGAGFLYARREVQPLLEPLIVSWGWAGEPGHSRLVDAAEYQGTRDPASFLTVPAAIQFMTEHDWPEVQRYCHQLASRARAGLRDLTGLEPICPDTTDYFAQMFAAPLPPCNAAEVMRSLYDTYHVEVPIIEWGGRQFVRVSIQGYNRQSDVDALLAALEAVLGAAREGQQKAGWLQHHPAEATGTPGRTRTVAPGSGGQRSIL